MQIKRLTRAQYRKTSLNGRGHFIYREWERELIICLFCLGYWFQWVIESIALTQNASQLGELYWQVRWGQRLSQTRPTPGSRTIIHSFLGSIQQNEGQHPASNNQSSSGETPAGDLYSFIIFIKRFKKFLLKVN